MLSLLRPFDIKEESTINIVNILQSIVYCIYNIEYRKIISTLYFNIAKKVELFLHNHSTTREQLLIDLKRITKAKPGYKLILENGHELTAILKFDDDLTFEYINPAILKAFGYSEEELLKESAVTFIHPDDRDAIVKAIHENLLAKEVCVEFRYRKKDGDYIWFETLVKLVPEQSKTKICDRSENPEKEIVKCKQVAKALEDSQIYYRVIFETSNTAMMIIDEQLRILDVNSEFEKLFGCLHEEVIGKKILTQVAAPESIEIIKKNYNLRKMNPDFAPKSYEVQCLDKQGKVRDILLSVSVVPGTDKVVASLLDMTKQYQTEHSLKYQVEFQKILLRVSREFTSIMVDDIDNMINDTLQLIGEFEEDDRCYVYILSDDGSRMGNTHEWCREEIEHEINNLENFSVDLFPWWVEKLRAFEIIHIPSVSDLPPQAKAEKEILKLQAVQSILVVPIIYENSLMGYIGFNSVRKEKKWTEESINLLGLVAQIFANALQRKKVRQELTESEQYYRTIFENTGDPSIIIAEDETISMANTQCERLFGYTCEELHGKIFSEFVSQDCVNKVKNYYRLRKIIPHAAPGRYESNIVDKNGKIKNIIINAAIIPGTKLTSATLTDVTQFNKNNRALQVSSTINLAIIHAEDEQELLENVCRKIVDVGGYSFAWVGYIEKNKKDMVIPVADAGYFQSLNPENKSIELKNCHLSKSLCAGRSAICRSYSSDCLFSDCKKTLINRGINSWLSIPLGAVNEEQIGLLNIYSQEKDAFDGEEVRLLDEMAEDLAYGIIALRVRKERDKTAHKLEESLEKMQRVLKQTVGALSTALEVRDPYTAGHQKNVAWLAGAIAKEMGLPREQIEGIYVAASLHDIGKINVPSEILTKPGKISEIEFELIKGHSEVGYNIVKDIEFPWPVAEILLQHHERIDGSGYPCGLQGKDMCIEAKILSVADVVEAMSSHRPYRPAIGIDEALKEISTNKGVLFDSDVVDACLRLFKEEGFKLK